jgi:hypothetical protein
MVGSLAFAKLARIGPLVISQIGSFASRGTHLVCRGVLRRPLTWPGAQPSASGLFLATTTRLVADR